MTSLFIVCWYPLYGLTLVDPKFELSTKLYKVLTLIAWSNAMLNPLVLMLFDYNVCASRRCAASKVGQVRAGSRGQWAGSGHRPSVYDRVGNRLCNERLEGALVAGRPNGLLSRDSSAQDLHDHEQVLADDSTQPWSRI